MKLSIIIPVFNEEKSIISVLKKVQEISMPNVSKEIIVIDDGSYDLTAEKIKEYLSAQKIKNIIFLQHKENKGKGAAVITGIKKASGEYIIIQDADLEYNPRDIPKLVDPIFSKNAEVVYGTRLNRLPNFSKEEREPLFILHYLGNRFLSLVTSILYGQWITDMETCYKVFPAVAVKKMQLFSRGFEFEPEITVKLLKQKYKIKEIPISTTPRGYKEGKKLNALRDGPKAFWILLKYRFVK